MAEQSYLAGLLTSFTPASAFWTGLLSGVVIFVISKLVTTARWTSLGQAQSLHIDLRVDHKDRDEINVEPGWAEEGGQADFFVRQWQIDEVFADESVGIG